MDCDLYSDLSLYNLELSDYRTAKGKVTKLFTPDTNPGYNEYGWGNTYKLSEKKMDEWNDGSEAEAAVRRHTIKNWDNIDHNYAMMKEFADFCKSHNIQMVLVTTPCWSSYYSNLDSRQLAKMYELTHRFQQEYGIPYYDYMKDPRFEADDFYDSNHLTDKGAIKFTKILNNDICQ